MYCYYCGRIKHRCQCERENSPIRQFLAVVGVEYCPKFLDSPYKRGVPPQIKRRERDVLRRNYTRWYRELVAVYGERCLGCGAVDEMVIDHIVPIARGGLSEPDNLQLLCKTCNRLKGKHVFDCRGDKG
ncbi:MAG: HNH endonuclease [Chloroflexi bacterium]|nr:HNH endonuclease [Chloroflexota bacterium]